MFMQRKTSHNPQEQRQGAGRGGGSAGNGNGGSRGGGGRGGGRRSENTKWCNEGMSHRPQSDFERFQNQDYGSGNGHGGGGYHNNGRGGK